MQTNYQSKHGKGGCFRSSVIRIHQQSRAVISIDNERLMFSLRWFEFKRNKKKENHIEVGVLTVFLDCVFFVGV